jgi:hypothetical protein
MNNFSKNIRKYVNHAINHLIQILKFNTCLKNINLITRRLNWTSICIGYKNSLINLMKGPICYKLHILY